MSLYHYHESDVRKQRVKQKMDRCPSNTNGKAFLLSDCIKNKKIFNPFNSSQLLSTRPLYEESSLPLFIYVVNKNKEMIISPDGNRSELDSVKHESLLHNDPVLAAGEIYIEEGVIVNINDHSGSYQTYGLLNVDKEMPEAILYAIKKAKASIFPDEYKRLDNLK